MKAAKSRKPARSASSAKSTSSVKPATPVAKLPSPAGYSGTPLPKKLGIKPGTKLFVSRAPSGFEAALGELPPGAALTARPAGSTLAVFFLRSRAELVAALPKIVERAAAGSVWLSWPKKTSGIASDLSENVVRDECLPHGIVDYKVAAIDQTWSGLAFARRKGK